MTCAGSQVQLLHHPPEPAYRRRHFSQEGVGHPWSVGCGLYTASSPPRGWRKIAQAGQGVVEMTTDPSHLDNPTFPRMGQHLRKQHARHKLSSRHSLKKKPGSCSSNVARASAASSPPSPRPSRSKPGSPPCTPRSRKNPSLGDAVQRAATRTQTRPDLERLAWRGWPVPWFQSLPRLRSTRRPLELSRPRERPSPEASPSPRGTCIPVRNSVPPALEVM